MVLRKLATSVLLFVALTRSPAVVTALHAQSELDGKIARTRQDWKRSLHEIDQEAHRHFVNARILAGVRKRSKSGKGTHAAEKKYEIKSSDYYQHGSSLREDYAVSTKPLAKRATTSAHTMMNTQSREGDTEASAPKIGKLLQESAKAKARGSKGNTTAKAPCGKASDTNKKKGATPSYLSDVGGDKANAHHAIDHVEVRAKTEDNDAKASHQANAKDYKANDQTEAVGAKSSYQAATARAKTKDQSEAKGAKDSDLKKAKGAKAGEKNQDAKASAQTDSKDTKASDQTTDEDAKASGQTDDTAKPGDSKEDNDPKVGDQIGAKEDTASDRTGSKGAMAIDRTEAIDAKTIGQTGAKHAETSAQTKINGAKASARVQARSAKAGVQTSNTGLKTKAYRADRRYHGQGKAAAAAVLARVDKRIDMLKRKMKVIAERKLMMVNSFQKQVEVQLASVMAKKLKIESELHELQAERLRLGAPPCIPTKISPKPPALVPPRKKAHAVIARTPLQSLPSVRKLLKAVPKKKVVAPPTPPPPPCTTTTASPCPPGYVPAGSIGSKSSSLGHLDASGDRGRMLKACDVNLLAGEEKVRVAEREQLRCDTLRGNAAILIAAGKMLEASILQKAAKKVCKNADLDKMRAEEFVLDSFNRKHLVTERATQHKKNELASSAPRTKTVQESKDVLLQKSRKVGKGKRKKQNRNQSKKRGRKLESMRKVKKGKGDRKGDDGEDSRHKPNMRSSRGIVNR